MLAKVIKDSIIMLGENNASTTRNKYRKIRKKY